MITFEELDQYLQANDPLYYQYKDTGQLKLSPWPYEQWNDLRNRWIYGHPTLPTINIAKHFLEQTKNRSKDLVLLNCMFMVDPKRADALLLDISKLDSTICAQERFLNVLIMNPEIIKYERSQRSIEDFTEWLVSRLNIMDSKTWLDVMDILKKPEDVLYICSHIVPKLIDKNPNSIRNFRATLHNYFHELRQKKDTDQYEKIRIADILAHVWYTTAFDAKWPKPMQHSNIPCELAYQYIHGDADKNKHLEAHVLVSSVWNFPKDFDRLHTRELWMIPQAYGKSFLNYKDHWLGEMQKRGWRNTILSIDGTTVITQELRELLSTKKEFWIAMLENFHCTASIMNHEIYLRIIGQYMDTRSSLLESIIHHIDPTFDANILHSLFSNFSEYPERYAKDIIQMINTNVVHSNALECPIDALSI